MVKVAKTYTVDKKGTGRIDNLGKIVSDRVQTFKGLELLPNEKLKKFVIAMSPLPSVYGGRDVLAPGESTHYIDSETTDPTPYIILAGYEFRIIKLWGSGDQPAMVRTYVDEFPPGNPLFFSNAFYGAGGVYSEQQIEMPSSAGLDPDFSDPHKFDFVAYNIGYGDMRGSSAITALLIKHSSEPFERDTKDVKCPFCGSIKTVSIKDTHITCDNGHDFIVEYHPWGGTV